MSVTPSFNHVEEFQGLYGPFQVSELLIQRIWLSQAFDVSGLVDSRGRTVTVEYPGDWNRLEGPDFKNAVLSVGDERMLGDVEIHFSLSDWNAHGHGLDVRYDKVNLHVLYHLPSEGSLEARTRSGRLIPSISLMPLLWYDLEEYAEQDSIVSSTGMDNAGWLDELLGVGRAERVDLVVADARERWEQKCAFARLRIERLGWNAACHQTALEIMGYRFNRIPMLQLAGIHSLENFEDGEFDLDEAWREQESAWKLTGCRPANHPRLRLEQYLSWCQSRRYWPKLLETLGRNIPVKESRTVESVSSNRRELNLKVLKERFSSEVLGANVGGMKVDTLICDGFWPLLASRLDRDFFSFWFSWYVGNVPDACLDNLKRLQILDASSSPASNGWMQGVLRRMLK